MAELPTPFQKVTDVDIAFGGIPNLEEAVAARPETIPNDLDWDRLAQLFFIGDLPREHLAEMNNLVRPELIQGDVAHDMLRYIRTWSGSFEPSHEDKLRVMSWCFSQLLVRPPAFVQS